MLAAFVLLEEKSQWVSIDVTALAKTPRLLPNVLPARWGQEEEVVRRKVFSCSQRRVAHPDSELESSVAEKGIAEKT